MPKIVVQNWEERERGWGNRPDGFTAHINMGQRDAYVAWYNKTYNNEPSVPDEYTTVCGNPFEVDVSVALFNRITEASIKKNRGRAVNCVHGASNYWSPDKRSLTEKDLTWPVSDPKGRKPA